MQPTRKARLESVIRDEISQLIRGIKDPRVPVITITSVSVTDDGTQATCYFSILGGMGIPADEMDEANRECREGLNSAAGFLRRQLAGALTTRHVPTLIFKQDKGLDNSIRVHELLKQIKSDDDDNSDPSTRKSSNDNS